MIEVISVKRKFVVKKGGKLIEIDDPNPDFTLAEVRKFLAGSYPDIVNGTIEGPEIKDDCHIYTFSTAIGTNG